MFCAGKYKMKNFIIFDLQFNMKSLMKCFVPAHFSLSCLVKYFVKVSSVMSLVDFIYWKG